MTAPRRRAAHPVRVLGAVVLALAASTAGASATAADDAGTSLYLVTLQGPGTSGTAGLVPPDLQAAALLTSQDAVLAEVDAPAPVYRWTTALNGVAVELAPEQATTLAALPDVALVEPSTVQRLARSATSGAPMLPTRARSGAGDGVVVGVVDSGVDPDSAVLAPVRTTSAPTRFRGTCASGPGWAEGSCTTKLVGGSFFVEGFGRDRVRSADPLSPSDADGHGTLVASIAAGDEGLEVRRGSARLGTFSGVAPAAQVAAYKACWTAPDPADDGCSTADLVAAIDRATSDGVDVLNLAVGGPAVVDTVERALLGASEAGIVVVTAAGNDPDAPAAHPSPWVLTVGAATGDVRRTAVRLSDGPTLLGAGSSTRTPPPLRLVLADRAAVAGAARETARACAPGSLDAAQAAGRAVLCVRGGGIARVEKSRAVAQAGGRAMLLVNRQGGSVDADFHAVPTVHLGADDGRTLRRWAVAHPRGTVELGPSEVVDRPAATAPWSSRAAVDADVVKPDLLAPGSGVLGAVPTATGAGPWEVLSGTSAASAQVAGAAAVLLGRHDWSADVVRSVLVTSADETTDGAPVLTTGPATRPGVAVLPGAGDLRAWLDTRSPGLDVPGVVLDATTAPTATTTRRVTNLGRRARTFSLTTSGLTTHTLLVAPSTLVVGPGESAAVSLTAVPVPGLPATPEAGRLVLSGDDDSRAALPVRVR